MASNKPRWTNNTAALGVDWAYVIPDPTGLPLILGTIVGPIGPRRPPAMGRIWQARLLKYQPLNPKVGTFGRLRDAKTWIERESRKRK